MAVSEKIDYDDHPSLEWNTATKVVLRYNFVIIVNEI